MENGVEALNIAFGMLIFVLAISITISCFSSAAPAIQGILRSKNLEEEFITDINGNYLNYISFDGGTREVGVETIVPMMYRAYREDFAIYFYETDTTSVTGYKNFVLYKYNGNEINYIDLDKDEQKRSANNISTPEKFINTILGTKSYGTLIGEYTENSLYEVLAGKTFIEKQGWYYIEGNTDVAEVNKTKKRVIAYIVN